MSDAFAFSARSPTAARTKFSGRDSGAVELATLVRRRSDRPVPWAAAMQDGSTPRREGCELPGTELGMLSVLCVEQGCGRLETVEAARLAATQFPAAVGTGRRFAGELAALVGLCRNPCRGVKKVLGSDETRGGRGAPKFGERRGCPASAPLGAGRDKGGSSSRAECLDDKLGISEPALERVKGDTTPRAVARINGRL